MNTYSGHWVTPQLQSHFESMSLPNISTELLTPTCFVTIVTLKSTARRPSPVPTWTRRHTVLPQVTGSRTFPTIIVRLFATNANSK